MSLPKTLVHIALNGLNEKAPAELADAQAVLATCENVQFNQDGMPETRYGYAECEYSTPADAPPTGTTSLVGTYAMNTIAARNIIFRDGDEPILTYMGGTTFTPAALSGVTRCSPERIATLQARGPQSREESGENSHNSSTAATTISDVVYIEGITGHPKGLALIAVSPSNTAGKTATDYIPICTLFLVSVDTGKVIDSAAVSVDLEGTTNDFPVAMKLVAAGDRYWLFLGGYKVASRSHATVWTGTVTATSISGGPSLLTTLTDYMYDNISVRYGLVASAHGTYSGGTRAFFGYHSVDGVNDGGVVKVIRLASGGVTSLFTNTYAPPFLGVTAFGITYHGDDDELVLAHANPGGATIVLKSINSSSGSVLTGRGGGGAGNNWTGTVAMKDTIIHLTRVSIWHQDEDTTATSMKCFGLMGCVSYLATGTTDFTTSVYFAQYGRTGNLDNVQFPYTTGRHFTALAMAAAPWTANVEGYRYAILPAIHTLYATGTNTRAQGLLFRIDGRINNLADVNPVGSAPPASPHYGCVGAFASGVLWDQSDRGTAFHRSQRLPSTPLSSDGGQAILLAGIVDGTNFSDFAPLYGPPQSIGVYRVSQHIKHLSRASGDFGQLVSAGYLLNEDGGLFTEACQLTEPIIEGATPEEDTVANLTQTTPDTYTYRAMFEYETQTGHVIWSGLSLPTTVTQAFDSSFCTVTVVPPTLRQLKPYRQVRCHVFRNEGNGDRYVGTIDFNDSRYYDGTVTAATLIDDTSTTDLGGRQQPYYDAEAVGGGTPLPRQPAASLRSITVHKDRVFGIDEDGVIRFTGPYVAGEHPWWSDIFQLAVPGDGRAVALASVGGRLFVFKTNAVYVVDGDGPPQNGGNGTEFSLPQKVSGNLGCLDARSVVETPYGIMFRSQRGIELLSANGSIEFVGERIQRTARTYPTTVASAYDPDTDCVKFLVSSIDEPVNGYVAGVTGGAILCLYVKSGAWAVHKVAVDAVSDSNFCDMVIVRDGARSVTVLASADGRVFVERKASPKAYDLDNPVTVKFATSWMKLGNAVNTRFRLWDAEFFGLSQNEHDLIMRLYYDYDSATPGRSVTFTSPQTDATPEILQVQPNREQLFSAMLEIEYSSTDSGSNGYCTKPLQLCLNVGPQDGLPLIPATQRK